MPNPNSKGLCITCPNCNTEIALSDALQDQFRHENEAHLAVLAKQAEEHAAKKLSADFMRESQLLKDQLAEESRKREIAQQTELTLRKEKSVLENRALELDLEVARRVDDEKKSLEAALRRGFAEQQDLKVKEKDILIDDLRKALEDARRKSEQGSQQRQGEALELDVEAQLMQRFPHDVVTPVAKGVRGADLMQEVRDQTMQVCGTIIWETKNTKHWSNGWVAKLKEDQRASGANIGVVISTVLPDSITEFGRIDGVWVTSVRAWPALAMALREQLIEVAFAHAAAEGKSEKMEILYRYLAGDQFRRRIEATVEVFTALSAGVVRERAAMERIWKERERQIERVMTNTAGMYGEVRGIVGSSVQQAPMLELDAGLAQLEAA